MLYNLEGKSYSGDPYMIIPDKRELRDVFKLVSLIAINALEPKSALGAFNDELSYDSISKKLMKLYGFKPKDLFCSFRKSMAKYQNILIVV